MAGKRKNVDDTAGMSKTAKASALKKGGKKEGFIAAAPENMTRVISLNGGQHCYLLDPRDGRTHHLRVNSEKWDAVVLPLLSDPSHGEHLQRDLMKVLGWERSDVEELQEFEAQVQ